MAKKLNFMIDIGMPTLVEELKKYDGVIIILKENKELEEDYIYSYENNILKIYLKSLNSLSDFEKLMNVLQKLDIKVIDYFFPFNERKLKIYYDFIKKYNIKSHLKEIYVKNSEKIICRKLINSIFNDVESSKLSDIDVEKFNYPCIIKPILGNGSTDIIKINSKEEMKELCNNIEKEKFFAETYIAGKEISIEAIHYNKKHLIYGITRKLKYKDSFVESGHVADQYVLTEKQLNKVKKIYDILNYDNTLSHSEFMLIEDDIIMIETHTRLGGDLIPSFYEEKFNGNMYNIITQCLMNTLTKKVNIESLKCFKFSIFPVPKKFPAYISLKDEEKEILKNKYGINLIIQNKVNGTKINSIPSNSFDRPLTLRGELSFDKDIDDHIEKIINFCDEKIFH